MQANPAPSGGEGVGVWKKTPWLTNANCRDKPQTEGTAPNTAPKTITSPIEAPIVALMAVNERLLMNRSTITTPHEPPSKLIEH